MLSNLRQHFYFKPSKTNILFSVQQLRSINGIKKNPESNFQDFLVLRGPERIRTAVGAFAELSLATRPRDHFNFKFGISDFEFDTKLKKTGRITTSLK